MVTIKTAKAKARRLQDFVRDLLLEHYPSLLKDTDVRSAIMGEPGIDVKLSKKAFELFPYSIECKAYKNPQVYPWYEQALANTHKETSPLLIVKADYKEPLVVLTLTKFMEIVK